MFYEEIQDGHQKWRENVFWQKMADDSADSLGVNNLVKITLSGTISEINVFYVEFQDKLKRSFLNKKPSTR